MFVRADACTGMKLGWGVLLSDLHQRVLSSSELNYEDCICRSLGCQTQAASLNPLGTARDDDE